MTLTHIKQLRKKLGLTQQELAHKAGVSQSFIAKIESDTITPSYTYANRIISCLEKEQHTQEPTAKDFMSARIYTCKPQDPVKNVVRRMQRLAISQLPVVKERAVVGLVTERAILKHLVEETASELVVQDVMQPPPPLIDISSRRQTAIDLLKHFSLIGVTRNGLLRGVVTRTDLISTYK